MGPHRIHFYKTRRNPNSLAALVGAIEVARGETVVASFRTADPAHRADDLPDLRTWSVGLFGPATDAVSSPLEATCEPSARSGRTVVAYSFMSVDLEAVKQSALRLKAEHPDWIFVAGGPHASGEPHGTLSLGFDHVFVGEGEAELAWFLDRVGRGATSPRILRPRGPLSSLDRFLSFAPAHNLLAPIELSRGCPFGCKFCHVPFVQGRKMRHRSVESVLEHVRISRSRGRVRTWFVSSDAFAYGSPDGRQGDRDRCERLLKGCRDEGMREVFWAGFPSEVRPDHVREELLELVVKYCANRTVVVGAQSGSDDVLRRIARGHTAASVIEAVRKIAAFGLIPHVDFIVGLPGETLAERRLTLDMIARVIEEFGGRVHVHYFMPHSGTPYASARPEPVEDEILDRLEFFTGLRKADGYWRRQRFVAADANPAVLEGRAVDWGSTREGLSRPARPKGERAGARSPGGSGADERSEEPPTPGCPARPKGERAGARSPGGSGADERSEEPPTPGCPARPKGERP